MAEFEDYCESERARLGPGETAYCEAWLTEPDAVGMVEVARRVLTGPTA